MPKVIKATSEDQDVLIEKIRDTVFGDKNWCVLHDVDHKPEVQEKIMEMIPELRKSFLIHNIAGVQRPDTLKRPWLSIMRTFLRKKYHVLSENYVVKRPEGLVATKRYVLLPKKELEEASEF